MSTKQKSGAEILNTKIRKFLTADEILAADAPNHEYDVVDIPQWNGAIRLRTMDGADAIAWGEKREADPKNAGLWLVHYSACRHDSDDLLFTIEQVEALKKRNQKVLSELVDRALVLNGLTNGATAARKND